MPYNLNKNIIEAKKILKNADAILIVTGAGMSVDSGIPTYRGNNGIWTKSIQIGNNKYSYDEISSLKMWKENPELAWGFKANFHKLMNNLKPHEGYYHLLKSIKDNYDYFICTSNIDGYFYRSGFDENKIYEVHGSINNLQCMDKSCNLRNGIVPLKKAPNFDPKTFIAKNLPKCTFCSKMSRPNVSMFGDYEFYGKPYEHQRNRLDKWLLNLKKYKKSLVILEIGCGINPHSLRMNNGKMMSGEWKMPKFDNNIGTIRINPSDEINENKTIHLSIGAKLAIKKIFD
jgi:NAD-dependent SIR2 family protein deacetylase